MDDDGIVRKNGVLDHEYYLNLYEQEGPDAIPASILPEIVGGNAKESFIETFILVDSIMVVAAIEAAAVATRIVTKIGKEVVETVVNKGTVNLTRQSVDDKLARYLLNMEHPVGGSKAKWFKEALGFTQDNIDDLAKQITFDPTKAVQTGVSEYGTKFNQTISITGANGKVIDVTFAWMKSVEDDVVRLVTAIPTKK